MQRFDANGRLKPIFQAQIYKGPLALNTTVNVLGRVSSPPLSKGIHKPAAIGTFRQTMERIVAKQQQQNAEKLPIIDQVPDAPAQT